MVIRKPSSHIRKLRNWLGYGLYTLVLLIGFLYVLFPYQDLQRWIETQIEQRMGMYTQAAQRQAGPFWFNWKDLRLIPQYPSMIKVFYFPLFQVSLHVPSIFSPGIQMTSAFSLWDGRGKGRLIFFLQKADYEYHARYSFTNLQVGKAQLPYIKSGNFSCDLDYQWNQNQPFFGQGQGKFSLTSVQIEDFPLYPEVTIPLTISNAKGLLQFEEAEITVRNFHLHGESMSFSGQGRVQMTPSLLDGPIEAEGILYLSQKFAQYFSHIQHLGLSTGKPIILKFSGTIRNPLLELNGVSIPLQPSLVFSSLPSFTNPS